MLRPRRRNQREESRVESPNEKDDYYREFGPPDKQGEEVGPDARVYHAYMKEAAVYDENLVQKYKDGVDIILVFAGLFSAVVTAFLIQASVTLQQDQTNVSPPDTISVWVNGLWACSLIASLCAALFAVLVKQGLYHYVSLSPDGSACYRSHLRQYRFIGLHRWDMMTILTDLLPFIIQASLALFFIGLCLFYIPLQRLIAIAIAAIAAVTFLLYFIIHIYSIFNPQYPFQTPFTEFFHFTVASTYQLPSYTLDIFSTISLHVDRSVSRSYSYSYSCSWVFESLTRLFSYLRPVKHRERQEVNKKENELAVETLYWLFTTSTNTKVHSIVVQALGGLSPRSHFWVKRMFISDVLEHVNAVRIHVFNQSTREGPMNEQRIVRSGCEGVVERIMRSLSVLDTPGSHWYQSLSIDVSTSTISSALAASMLRHFPRSMFHTPRSVFHAMPSETEDPAKVSSASKYVLSEVIRPNREAYASEWELALTVISSPKWSMDFRVQISEFLLLILVALQLRISDEPRRSPQPRWRKSVDIKTFTKEMTSDSFLWGLIVEHTIEAFEGTASAVSPLPQSSDMKARVAMKMVCFALDRLGDDARITYLRLLAESLRLLHSVLDLGQDRGLVRDTYESFPSLCIVLIDRANLMETKDDGDREVVKQIHARFKDLISVVLSPTPVPSPLLMDVISFFACSVVDRYHPLRNLEKWKNTVYWALDSMFNVLTRSSTSEGSTSDSGALMMFVDEDWVHLLCGWLWLDPDREPSWASSVPLLISAFAERLKEYKDTRGKRKARISSYILQDNNLLYSILMLGFDIAHSPELGTKFRSDGIARLVSLVPDPVKLKGVKEMLSRTLSWRDDATRTAESFPLNDIFRVLRDSRPTNPRRWDIGPSSWGIRDEEVPLERRLRQMIEGYEQGELHDCVQKIVKIIDEHFAT